MEKFNNANDLFRSMGMLQEHAVEIPALSDNLYGIDINVDFNNVAVYFRSDFKNLAVVDAHICEFKQIKKYGVLPNNNADNNEPKFNCCIGDYFEDEATVVLKDLKYEDFDFMSKSAGSNEYERYSIATLLKENLNKFLPYKLCRSDVNPFGWYGFFESKKIASEKFEVIKSQRKYEILQELKTLDLVKIS